MSNDKTNNVCRKCNSFKNSVVLRKCDFCTELFCPSCLIDLSEIDRACERCVDINNIKVSSLDLSKDKTEGKL